jgi:hypothetical protein
MRHKLPFDVIRHMSWDRAPRDPVTTFITNALVGAGLGATAASIVAYIAVSVATNMVLSALTPKPSFGASGSQGLLVNSRGALQPEEFVYGTVRKGGTETFYETTGENNKLLHKIVTIAGHEIDAFEAFFLNDEAVTLDANGYVTSAPWNSKIRILAHRGNQTASTDNFANASTNLQSTLHAETSVGSTFIGKEIAYLYVRMEYDEDVFANGIPLITTRVRGKKVYDPRTDTTAYSANAALCIRDYIRTDYGLGYGYTDDVSFAAAANVCDEDVSLAGGGTEKRYEMHGVVFADTKRFDALGKMVTACGGSLFYGGGEYKLKPSDYTVPVKDLTLDDLRSGISLDPKLSSRDNFNTVRGTFVDRDQDYISADFPFVTSDTFKAEDGGEENAIDLELPFTTSSAMAQRLAKLTLYRGREQIAVSADFSIAAFDLEVGDIVTFTNPNYGFDQKEFEVQNWRFFADPQTGAIKVSLYLREISEAALDWNAEESEIIANNTTLLKYYDAPAVGITAEAVAKVLAEKLVNQLVVNVTSAGSERVSSVEVQYRPTGDTIYVGMGSGPLGAYTVLDLPRGQYDIRARSINSFGYKGEWEYLNAFDVDALSAPPANVTGFAYELSGGTLFFSWLPVADLDLSYYEVRYSPSSSGVTWGNAQFAIRKIARPATSVTAPARSGTWLIKAFDKGGNESVNATTTYVSAAELPPLGTSQTLTEDPTFTGTKTNAVVDTTPNPDELIINNRTSATLNTAEYAFHDIIDAGSSRVARVTGTVTFDRYYPDAGLWSKIHGTWTSWPDNFSTWTDEQAAFGDHDVQIYAATSDDNVTYGAWTAANGQELVGRFFKFKAVLESTNLNVSPAIKTLSAEVAY